MTRRMFDSVTVADLPEGGDLYLGYVNGIYRNLEAVRARFGRRAIVVGIATRASVDAQVLDVENGDATPQEAPGWAHRQRARGQEPTVYCLASAWATVRACFRQAGELEPQWGIAHYDGKAELPAGAVFKQYANPILTGGHFDASVVADHWKGVDMDPELERMIRETHAAIFDGVPTMGMPAIRDAASQSNYALAGIDLDNRPSLIKRILSKLP